MDCLEALTTRSGVLDYRPDPVEKGLIEQVLNAAISAPSPANLQAWSFVVVTHPEKTRKLAHYLMDVQDRKVFQEFLGLQPEETGRYMRLYEMFDQVPCFIIICLEPKCHFTLPEHESILRDWYLLSLGAAVGNLMAAAKAFGLGTRWFGGFALDGGGQYLKELFSIPGDIEIAAVTPLGYPADSVRPRKRIEQSREELSAFEREDSRRLAQMLRGKLPLKDLIHYEKWVG
ncbi:MAG: hypothetical protein EHM41_17250 [Chloroflexi bacterium]|nr:MAG: hypothetical protein EHM41_17250 [Chloroflexota bacterium]